MQYTQIVLEHLYNVGSFSFYIYIYLLAYTANLRLGSKVALQQRFLKTEALNETENLALLNHQRNLRPSSPHFTIYQPQLTWFGSIAHRFTGIGLSAGIYAFAIGYVTLPFVGAGFESQSLIELVQSAPVWFKTLIKAPIAAAFTFHSFNGIRHLLWDTGKCEFEFYV